jgi:hypothetical protein
MFFHQRTAVGTGVSQPMRFTALNHSNLAMLKKNYWSEKFFQIAGVPTWECFGLYDTLSNHKLHSKQDEKALAVYESVWRFMFQNTSHYWEGKLQSNRVGRGVTWHTIKCKSMYVVKYFSRIFNMFKNFLKSRFKHLVKFLENL